MEIKNRMFPHILRRRKITGSHISFWSSLEYEACMCFSMLILLYSVFTVTVCRMGMRNEKNHGMLGILE